LEKGVLLAVDHQQEWLLPWWWANYSKTNALPVAIVDLGMSSEARAWCKVRAKIIEGKFESAKIKSREECGPEISKKWEEIYGSTVWQARQAWFKKPLSMLETPFQTTLWLDLDCEILGSLDPVFSVLPQDAQMGIVREPIIRQGEPGLLLGEVVYNSGVILYRKNSSLIKKWADESLLRNDQFLGDQQLLSRIIFSEKIPIFELPDACNVQPSSGVIPDALIVHWVGNWGKEFIRLHGGLRRLFL
jgi:hypothetical protein